MHSKCEIIPYIDIMKCKKGINDTKGPVLTMDTSPFLVMVSMAALAVVFRQ